MYDRRIINGTLCDGDKCFKADIYISEGKIKRVVENPCEKLPAGETTDAFGMYVLPGFIDTHVHSRDGISCTHEKEDFFHSTQAAAVGGFTTIYEMPNCNPSVYSEETLKSLVNCVEKEANTDFCCWGLSLGDVNADEISRLDKCGVVGFKFFWGYAIDKNSLSLKYDFGGNKADADNLLPPPDRGEILDMFARISETNKPLGIHAEDFEIIKRRTNQLLARKSVSEITYSDMLNIRPAVCETSVIESAIAYAKVTGVHLHIHHLAVGDSVDIIRRAKESGVNVTCETCPQYLFLSKEEDEHLGTRLKWFPLVRERFNQEKLWQGINDGTIDHVSSDHAPHTIADKEKCLFSAPSGMPGVETMGITLIDAVNKGKLSLEKMVTVLSKNPALLYGNYPNKGSLLENSDADIVIVDMKKRTVFSQNDMHSISKLSPFDGREFIGYPEETILRGKTIAKGGETVSAPTGKFIKK